MAKKTARQIKVEQMNKDEAKAKLAGKETYSIADKVFTDLEEAKAYAKKIAAELPPEKSLTQALTPWNIITRKKKSKPTAAKKPEKVKPATKAQKQEKKIRPNPFAKVDDVYLTKNTIAVTKTQKSKAKRGYSKTTQTKYYKKNSTNLKLLKAAQGDTVRIGRTGTNYGGI